MNKSVSISVSGRVQGVAFRYSAQSLANNLGLKGFVRNMSDGSVYIEVEGQPHNVDAYIEWCRKGPSRAEIENIFINPIPEQHFTGFLIR